MAGYTAYHVKHAGGIIKFGPVVEHSWLLSLLLYSLWVLILENHFSHQSTNSFPGTLMSILGWMMIASLLNIFFRSQLIFQANLYIGLAVFCVFVLYDTQLIIEKRRMGDEDYVW